MAAVTDYTTLKDAIIATAEDDGQEFMDFLDTCIDIAQEVLFRELDMPDIETKVTGTMIPATTTIPKPTGYRFANYIKILVPDTINPLISRNLFLKKRRDDYLQDYWPDPSATEVPKYYSDSSVSVFSLAPSPNLAYIYEIKYTPQPIKLSLANPTNYYTDRCSDILYSACMVEMSRFMKAWSQVQAWEAEYEAAKAAWNLQERKVRRDDGQTPRNPTNGPNDTAHTATSNA